MSVFDGHSKRNNSKLPGEELTVEPLRMILSNFNHRYRSELVSTDDNNASDIDIADNRGSSQSRGTVKQLIPPKHLHIWLWQCVKNEDANSTKINVGSIVC